MAGFNRFGGGGLGSLYTGIGGLGQGNVNRRDDRFDDRGRSGRGMSGFERRDVDRDFGRRDPSPRRRRYSPEPPYSSIRGRRDDRGDLGSYSLDHMGSQDSFRSRGGNVNPQLAQQQQQLMAMVQTQSLLAAIQAQASAAVKQVGPGNHPPSLLQGMRMHDNRMDRQNFGQNRKRRMSPNRNQMRNRNQQGNRMQYRQNQQSSSNNNNNNRQYGQNRRSARNQRSDQERMDWYVDKKKNDSARKSEDDEGPYEEPYVEDNPDEDEEAKPLEKEKETKETETPKEEPKEKEDEPPKEQATEKEDPKPKTQPEESVPKSSINLAGQNVDKLTKSLFDTYRRKYVCKVCKIMCTKETCFRQHLFGRRHVKTWLENQGQSFEAVIFKKATEEAAKTLAASEISKPESSKPETSETSKENAEEQTEKKEEQSTETSSVNMKEEEPEVKEESTPPPNTEPKVEPEPPKEEKKVQVLDVKYSCETRKMAVKNGEYITITSINEARVKINGFDTGLNTKGCEFVKAVSGFQCRLCRSFIHYGSDVLKHVKGKKHQANYRNYILEHPRYEQNQKKRNKELDDMLSEKEGDTILLYEVSDEEEEVRRPSRFSRQDSSLYVKPSKFIAVDCEQENAVVSIEDKNDADASQQESEHQEDNDEHDKSNVSHDVPDEEENEPPQEQEQDTTLESESITEDDQKAEDELLMETEEEKINSEEIADISIEADISLSDLANEVMVDEPVAKKTKPTTAAKRGRKAARGGQGGRGRGRGRGVKKNTRQSPRAPTKPELSSDDHNEDVDFMDGFEVIDEVNDDEN